MTKKVVHILGATGSVGQSAADVIAAHSEHFEVGIISAHTSVEKLQALETRLNAKQAILTGEEGGTQKLEEALGAYPADITLAAIVGMEGLRSLLTAIPNNKAIAIANKEPLVAAGKLVTSEAANYGTKLIPVDSEHNAIFQVFEEKNKASIERLILTASGGPFRTFSIDQIKDITPEQAVKHPNWSMGRKISIDSATMMNKALEVIEAHILFDMPKDKIDVLIHPQSIIHSMVEYNDGSILAQLGAPDMRTPVLNALSWPVRLSTPGERLDFRALAQLDFEVPNTERFPSLRLAYECLAEGQEACLVLNAVNEIAVDAFLNKSISFPDITNVCEDVLQSEIKGNVETLEEILDFDKNVRQTAKSVIITKYSH